MTADASNPTSDSAGRAWWASVASAIVIVVWAVAGTFFPFVLLSENQALYIYSSAAQVLAAMYGLTIAGYVFVRNQQDREADKDETLYEILEQIQRNEYRLIVLLTILSTVSTLLSLLVIATREIDGSQLHLWLLNSAAGTFTLSLFWMAFLIADALRPGKVKRASARIKEEILSAQSQPAAGGETAPAAQADQESWGNLTQFVWNFNRVQRLLEAFGSTRLELPGGAAADLPEGTSDEAARQRKARWPKLQILKVMASERLITPQLHDELAALVRYRNALLHGDDLSVDRRLLQRMVRAREALERALPGSAPPRDPAAP